jgi:hypothetical protein
MGRFLADENMPRQVVEALRAVGMDVTWVRTLAPGLDDRGVLTLAAREARVLLTFDKDFGELAYRAALPPGCGVVLLRLPMPPPVAAGTRIADLILSRTDWPDHFAVIEPDRIRIRPLGS